MTKSHLKKSNQAGLEWRDQNGSVRATEKADYLKKKIQRGTEKRQATQCARAIISGLLGKTI